VNARTKRELAAAPGRAFIAAAYLDLRAVEHQLEEAIASPRRTQSKATKAADALVLVVERLRNGAAA
jgi:hypothetical protein